MEERYNELLNDLSPKVRKQVEKILAIDSAPEQESKLFLMLCNMSNQFKGKTSIEKIYSDIWNRGHEEQQKKMLSESPYMTVSETGATVYYRDYSKAEQSVENAKVLGLELKIIANPKYAGENKMNIFEREKLALSTDSPEVLAKLAKDDQRLVRRAVAENLHTSAELLADLAKDQEFYVRMSVAQNPNTSLETLSDLAKDQDSIVRCSVAGNSSTSAELLSDLSKDQELDVRESVAENLNTPAKVLSDLAKDQDFGVRYLVADNPSTSPETLADLAKDQDLGVCEKAKENLSRKQAENESAEMSM